MKVDHAAQSFLYYPQQRFPFVESPFYIATDFPWQSASLNWGDSSNGLVCDYELQAVYPAPLFVPHHQCKDPNTGNLNAFWKYRRVPPPTSEWAAYMQLTDTAQMDTGNPPLGKYGAYANSLIGPGVAWKMGTSNNATFDFRFNDQYGFVEMRVLPLNFTPGDTYYNQPTQDASHPFVDVDSRFDQNYKSASTKSIVSSTGLPAKFVGGRCLDIYTDDLACQGATFMWLMTTPRFGTSSTLSQALNVIAVDFTEGQPITVTVATSHGLHDGDFVTITDVLAAPPLGSPAPSYANGEWEVVNCTDTSFQIVGLVGNGFIYNSGGHVFPMCGALEFFIGVGTGSDQQQYRVLMIEGHDPILYREMDSGGWTKLRSLPWGAGQSQAKVQQDQNLSITATTPYLFPSSTTANETELEWLPPQKQFEVRLIGGRLQFRMNAGDEAYYVDELRVGEDGSVVNQINFARIRATYVSSMACSMHPMKFRANARYVSPEISIGFRSDNFSGFAVDYAGSGQAPGNAIVDLDEAESDLNGPTVQYILNFSTSQVIDRYKGIEYVDFAPIVRAVHLAWEPVILPSFPLASSVTPERIVTRSVFNLDDLTIGWDGELWFNANGNKLLPDGTTGAWGDWSRRNGQRAAEINLARTLANGGLSAFYRVFTGYAHTTGSVVMNPTSDIGGAGSMAGTHFRMGLADRFIQLDSDEFALPWMDGWNYFYAIAYLGQLAGISLQDMAFSGYVPDVPYGPGSDLGTPEGLPAPYLPVGDGGTVQTRYTGLPPREVMKKLAYAIGYMLFFDAEARLDTRKFRIPTGVKRIFYESDVASTAQVNGGMEGCRNVQTGKDHSVVRNQTVIAGINAFAPLYDPIVVKYSDDESIHNPLVFNHLGYRQRFAWIDSQFADPYFADQAAQKMHAYLRTPAITVNFETSWLQPDIFPIDVIMFQSAKTGTAFLPMLVTSVIHDVTIDTARSMISARYIPL